MLRSKCATLVLRGGGKRQLGSFGASFSRVRAICPRGRLAAFEAKFWKSGQHSFFLRNGAIFGVVTRKNRSFCGMRGAKSVKLSANFWKSFFLRPRLKFRSFCGTGKSWLGARVVFWKFSKSLPQIVRSAVGSVWRADTEPQKSTADTEPAVSAPVFGAPYQPYFQQPKFSVFWLLAAVGMTFFEKKEWAPYQPSGVQKMGPRINPYIYICCSVDNLAIKSQ